MSIRPEVIPFIVVALLAGGVTVGLCLLCRLPRRGAFLAGALLAGVAVVYFLYFFRDPSRTSPPARDVVVSGADGRIAGVTRLTEEQFRQIAPFCGLDEAGTALFTDGGPVLRISIFLSLFDVHVNRSPISGDAEFLGYFPGKHLFTFQEKSSDVNQHNSILIHGEGTVCLVNQIVGPVARRVVYWPDHDRKVPLEKGQRIGMMKFGSRLDMYFPGQDVTVEVKEGDVVSAGESIVARLKEGDAS